MRDKKLQVFVSSTYTDLKEERQAAVEAILSSGNIPAGMELFAAGDESQMTVIKRWIDESDVYLLILGGRYGSIEKISGKSYIQLEYEYALEQKKPLFAVVITEDSIEKRVKEFGTKVIEKENQHLLKSFRELVLSNLSEFWNEKRDIQLSIFKTLSEFEHTKKLIGWVRGDKAVDAGPLAEQIAALSKENSELREKIDQNYSRYSGLSYEELKKMLESEKIGDEGSISLFQYLINNGDMFTVGTRFTTISTDLKNKLTKYRLVNRIGDTLKFTDDGHNFYLKALTLKT